MDSSLVRDERDLFWYTEPLGLRRALGRTFGNLRSPVADDSGMVETAESRRTRP